MILPSVVSAYMITFYERPTVQLWIYRNVSWSCFLYNVWFLTLEGLMKEI